MPDYYVYCELAIECFLFRWSVCMPVSSAAAQRFNQSLLAGSKGLCNDGVIIKCSHSLTAPEIWFLKAYAAAAVAFSPHVQRQPD